MPNHFINNWKFDFEFLPKILMLIYGTKPISKNCVGDEVFYDFFLKLQKHLKFTPELREAWMDFIVTNLTKEQMTDLCKQNGVTHIKDDKIKSLNQIFQNIALGENDIQKQRRLWHFVDTLYAMMNNNLNANLSDNTNYKSETFKRIDTVNKKIFGQKCQVLLGMMPLLSNLPPEFFENKQELLDFVTLGYSYIAHRGIKDKNGVVKSEDLIPVIWLLNSGSQNTLDLTESIYRHENVHIYHRGVETMEIANDKNFFEILADIIRQLFGLPDARTEDFIDAFNQIYEKSNDNIYHMLFSNDINKISNFHDLFFTIFPKNNDTIQLYKALDKSSSENWKIVALRDIVTLMQKSPDKTFLKNSTMRKFKDLYDQIPPRSIKSSKVLTYLTSEAHKAAIILDRINSSFAIPFNLESYQSYNKEEVSARILQNDLLVEMFKSIDKNKTHELKEKYNKLHKATQRAIYLNEVENQLGINHKKKKSFAARLAILLLCSLNAFSFFDHSNQVIGRPRMKDEITQDIYIAVFAGYPIISSSGSIYGFKFTETQEQNLNDFAIEKNVALEDLKSSTLQNTYYVTFGLGRKSKYSSFRQEVEYSRYTFFNQMKYTFENSESSIFQDSQFYQEHNRFLVNIIYQKPSYKNYDSSYFLGFGFGFDMYRMGISNSNGDNFGEVERGVDEYGQYAFAPAFSAFTGINYDLTSQIVCELKVKYSITTKPFNNDRNNSEIQGNDLYALQYIGVELGFLFKT